MAVAVSPASPDAESSAVAARALERVRAYLRTHPDGPATVRLVDDESALLVVPHGAVELLAQILAPTWPAVTASRSCPRRPS